MQEAASGAVLVARMTNDRVALVLAPNRPRAIENPPRPLFLRGPAETALSAAHVASSSSDKQRYPWHSLPCESGHHWRTFRISHRRA